MANELTLNLRINYSKGGAKFERDTGTSQITIAGTAVASGIRSASTSWTSQSIVAAPGYVYVKNLDSTNYLELGPDGTASMVKLKAGQWGIFPIAGTTLYTRANTAAVDFEFACFSL